MREWWEVSCSTKGGGGKMPWKWAGEWGASVQKRHGVAKRCGDGTLTLPISPPILTEWPINLRGPRA